MISVCIYAQQTSMIPVWYGGFAWGLGGILVGYIGGILINKQDERPYRLIVGAVLLALIALSAVLNYTNAKALNESVTCQRKFNYEYRSALQALVSASQIETDAMAEFLNSFRRADIPPAAGREQPFIVLDGKRADAKRLRDSHPLPVINPCGGPA